MPHEALFCSPALKQSLVLFAQCFSFWRNQDAQDALDEQPSAHHEFLHLVPFGHQIVPCWTRESS